MRKRLLFLIGFLVLFSANRLNPSIDETNNSYFSENELRTHLTKAIEQSKNIYSQYTDKLVDTEQTVELLIKNLKRYNVSGFSMGLDGNIALLLDWQDPEFDLTFKTSDGEIKQRRYHFDIFSIGIKGQLGVNINLLFFVNTNLNFYNSRKKMPLGLGVTVGIGSIIGGGIFLNYINLSGIPGGLLLVSIPIGLCIPDISLILGGSMTPTYGYDDEYSA